MDATLVTDLGPVCPSGGTISRHIISAPAQVSIALSGTDRTADYRLIDDVLVRVP